MFDKLRADMRHYRNAGGWYQSPGFWVTATYRFGSWAHGLPVTSARLPLLAAYKMATLPWRVLRNVSIPARTRIGAGFCMHHPHNVIMPPDVAIGDNCTLYHEVTLGRGPVPGVPTLGNNVTVYAGAKILGGVRVGDDVEIGANAVVVRDIESGAVVSAPPSRTIPAQLRERIDRARRAVRK